MNATERILRHASQLGFDDCAVARCHPLNSQRETFEEWLEHGYDGSLSYLRRHVAKRFDPSLLVEGARSVIVCAVSYHRPLSEGDIPSRIASYAHSRDYHLTLREKLAELLVLVRELYPDSEGRAFTDTAPIASNKAFRPVPELERMNAEQWLALNRAQFDRLFSQTPLARCGLQKLQDRIRKLGKE